MEEDRATRDTGEIAIITGRHTATIRTVCAPHRQDGGYRWPDALDTLEAHPGEVAVVTAAQAEQLPGIAIPANRIYQWLHVGLIEPVDRESGAPRYAVDDLVRLRNRLDRKAQLDQ